MRKEQKDLKNINPVINDHNFWELETSYVINEQIYNNQEVEAFKRFSRFYWTDHLKKIAKDIQKRIGDIDQRKTHWSLIAPVNAGKSALGIKIKELIERNPVFIKCYNRPAFVPHIIAPERMTWKELEAELLFRIGIKKKARLENTGDLGRDIEDQLMNFHHDGLSKIVPLMIFDNFDKIVLERKEDIRYMLDGLLTLSQRVNCAILLVGTPDLLTALKRNPSLSNRFPPLYIKSFEEQVFDIQNNPKIDELQKKNEIINILKEFRNIFYTYSYELATGGEYKDIQWSFPNQIKNENLLSNKNCVDFFLTTCKGRLGEIFQTLRLAGMNVLESGDKAITFNDICIARQQLGMVFEDTTYQYSA